MHDNNYDSGHDSVDSRKLKSPPIVPIIPRVKFTIDGDDNADVLSSSDSSDGNAE